MLKLLIFGLSWDSHLPASPSSDDTDEEDKAEDTSVCPLRYASDGMCHFSPHGLCPNGVTPGVRKGHQQISSSKQVMDIIDGLRLYCSYFTGRKNRAQVLSWMLHHPI